MHTSTPQGIQLQHLLSETAVPCGTQRTRSSAGDVHTATTHTLSISTLPCVVRHLPLPRLSCLVVCAPYRDIHSSRRTLLCLRRALCNGVIDAYQVQGARSSALLRLPRRAGGGKPVDVRRLCFWRGERELNKDGGGRCGRFTAFAVATNRRLIRGEETERQLLLLEETTDMRECSLSRDCCIYGVRT